jgi:hypothetical protein
MKAATLNVGTDCPHHGLEQVVPATICHRAAFKLLRRLSQYETRVAIYFAGINRNWWMLKPLA